MSGRERQFWAFLFAPLSAIIPWGILLFLWVSPYGRWRIYLPIFAYSGMLVFWLVHAGLLARRGWTNWWTATLAGFVCGVGTSLLLEFILFPMSDIRSIDSFVLEVFILLFHGLSGALVATVFWLIARPDKYSLERRP